MARIEGLPIAGNQPRGVWVFHHAADCAKVNDPTFGPLAYPDPERPCTCEKEAEMQTHELKAWPTFFEPVFAGKKNWEVRVNDRDFKSGDVLLLREWDPEAKRFTGRWCRRLVSHVLPAEDLRPLGVEAAGMVFLGLMRILIDGREVTS